jgi:DHA2 family multidrug resistance protein-like MFS transporter
MGDVQQHQYRRVQPDLQLALGLSPLLAALANLPGMTALVLAASQVPRLARRLPARILVGGGLLLVSAGELLLTRLDGTDDLPWIVVANIVMSAGVAPTTVLVTQIIVGAAPQWAAGTASGAAQAANEFGGALGIALLGGLTSAVYRRALDQAPGADDYRGPDTYAGLVGSPGDKSPALLAAARAAFVDGVTASVLVSATVMIAIGAAVLVRLHRTSTAPPDEPSGAARTGPGPTGAGDPAAATGDHTR